MKNLKNILAAIFLIVLTCATNAEAADRPKIMIVDIGQFEDSAISRKNKNLSDQDNELLSDIRSDIRSMISDYMINAFVNIGRFSAFGSDLIDYALLFSGKKNFEMKSTAPLARMKEIAEHFNIDYVIYGDFKNLYGNSVIMKPKFRNEKFHSLKIEITAQVLDVKNNRIIATATGEGISKRFEMDKVVTLDHHGNLVLEMTDKEKSKLSGKEFTILSVQNATKKAAIDLSTKLMKAFPEL